jgi:catalase
MLAETVGKAIGENYGGEPSKAKPKGTADSPTEMRNLADATTPTTASGGLLTTKGLSIQEGQPKLAKGRKVAILVAPGVDVEQVEAVQGALKTKNVLSEIVGPYIGEILGEDEVATEATKTYANTSSVHFDAVYIPGGGSIEALMLLPDAIRFVDEAYKHGKPIAASAEGVDLVMAAGTGKLVTNETAAKQGVLLATGVNGLAPKFLEAIANHRFFNRDVDKVIA